MLMSTIVHMWWITLGDFLREKEFKGCVACGIRILVLFVRISLITYWPPLEIQISCDFSCSFWQKNARGHASLETPLPPLCSASLTLMVPPHPLNLLDGLKEKQQTSDSNSSRHIRSSKTFFLIVGKFGRISSTTWFHSGSLVQPTRMNQSGEREQAHYDGHKTTRIKTN